MEGDDLIELNPARGGPRGRARAALTVQKEPSPEVLRKAVNTLAIIPKSTRITTLGRKSYNVLLYQAQEQGLERETFRVPLDMSRAISASRPNCRVKIARAGMYSPNATGWRLV